MTIRIIDDNLSLVPYYPNEHETLPWYQDIDLVKQVDNHDQPYTLVLLQQMYTYLDKNGECFYIKYKGNLVGDITLLDTQEICIVISKPYQNQHIGRKCIKEIMKLASEKRMDKVTAKIYPFNTQSKRVFETLGFKQIDDEKYEFEI